MGKLVNVVFADGKTRPIPEEHVGYAIAEGAHLETADEAAAVAQEARKDELYGGVAGAAAATNLALLRGASFGATDFAVDSKAARELRERHSGLSTAGEIFGGVATSAVPFAPAGLAARAGEGAAAAIRGGGVLTEVARAGVGTAIEGGLQGLGSSVTELALSDDPLTIERAASVLGSNALLGAVTGGALGAVGKTAEKGLLRAKSKLDDIAKGASTPVDAAAADIATLDRKGLRVAEKAEIDAIEAARVPKRAELADEIKALRAEMKEQKIYLATKDADVKAIKEVREVGKTALEADKAIDRMLRNPKALASRPQRVLDGLQQQEHALELLVGQSDKLKPIFASDASGVRQAALDYASTALEKNRALQAKIGELTAKPTSARLEAIADRLAGGGAAPAAKAGLGDAIADAGLGYAVGAAAGVPVLGQLIAAGRVGMGIVKKLGLDTSAAAARGSKAIESFVNVGAKVARPAPVLASKVLAGVRYGQAEEEKATSKRKAATLADSYRARSSELRSLTAPGPDGKPVMRLEARAKMAAHLQSIAAVSPKIADGIETVRARGVEFLADKLPRKPDLPGMGPHDGWQPSDMEMRGFARYVAAVEDPHGVVERLASGEVTPEDAEVMSKVYPEMYAQIQSEIMGQLGELRAKLPYQRRLALSVFSGVPVDPALDPRVLAVLQGSFAAEPGTEGGVQAPRAQPAFGSVSKPEPTPAQQRGA